MGEPLPVAHVDDQSVYPEGNDRQGFLGAQVRTTCKNVATLTTAASQKVGSGTSTQCGSIEQYLGRRTLELGETEL